jgi:hypothetical protein
VLTFRDGSLVAKGSLADKRPIAGLSQPQEARRRLWGLESDAPLMVSKCARRQWAGRCATKGEIVVVKSRVGEKVPASERDQIYTKREVRDQQDQRRAPATGARS